MKMLLLKDYLEIRSWIYRNARQVNLAQWQYYFENGSKEAVLSALSFYQNEDGGFGHALEADSWNPNSSPYTTLFAINILKGIGFNDMQHPIMRGIFKFLESKVHCSDEGWYFNIPSNNDFAHAPWWTCDMEANATESIGLTAQIISFILINAHKNSELFNKALTLSEKIISKLDATDKYGEMGLGGYCVLLDAIERAELTQHFNCSLLAEKIKKLVHNTIVRDTSKWAYYTRRPSDYIHSPESIFYKENEDIVQTELDYIIDTRPQNGVWDITWSWFENNEKYAREFSISENWWKASVAIEKLNYLRNFNRFSSEIVLPGPNEQCNKKPLKRAFMQIYIQGRAEAIEFYQRAFDADLGYNEKNADGTYIHAELNLQDYVIAVGEDSGSSKERITGNTMQFCLHFRSKEEAEVKKAYEVLREGGKVNVPLGHCFFSPCMTDITDRYGVRWCLFVDGE